MLSKFQAKTLEGIFVGYGAESHTYRIYDKTSRFVIESCSVEFEDNDGSQVDQPNVSSEDANQILLNSLRQSVGQMKNTIQV